MPTGTGGALVRRISGLPGGPLDVIWLPTPATRLPLGRIRLLWEPAPHAGWTVHAHLGLATTEVLLAPLAAAPDHWPNLIRPTLYEVTGLCHALAYATTVLDLSKPTRRSPTPRPRLQKYFSC
ncbi:esterase [Streptomyces sp. CBMA29]|uniref:esterase n=1 Tax=Streptomyces sp. CBMA29 TaxID=1896314 RepID=UPI001661D191|nr:esterase [Streptomyces sp. CBMA29]MBD0740267.1 esterase [Streptomyces sp. CBMA29]